ncbi:hypothetical protein L596_021630 [Steinernema carpocapsae]|uniref:RING-type domain-containing protein n=1 Tax=Steinernema carpocapsae TaxID=34508 RepID=A0A4U5MK51_STECR|nr:hypothetical protein L596_021630 [Steinernema carpocapsae]
MDEPFINHRRKHERDEILEKQNELIRLVKLYPLEEIDYSPKIRDYDILYDALIDTFGEECIGGACTYPFKLPCQVNEFNVEERISGLRFQANLKVDDYVVFEFDDDRMVTRCFVNPCALPDHRPLLPVIDNVLYRILDKSVVDHVCCENEMYVRDHIVEKFEERHYFWGSRISSSDVGSICARCGESENSGVATLQCGHYFCFDCWVQYITRRIATKEFPMYCPQPNCQIMQPAGGLLTFIPKALVDCYGCCVVDKEIAEANTKYSKCWRCDELILLGVHLLDHEEPVENDHKTDEKDDAKNNGQEADHEKAGAKEPEEAHEEIDQTGRSARDSSYESESPEPRFKDDIRVVICECGAASCCECRLKAHEPLSCEEYQRFLEINGEYVAPTFSIREQLEEFLTLSQFSRPAICREMLDLLRKMVEEEDDDGAISLCKQLVHVRL